jgi:hypothetical protein
MTCRELDQLITPFVDDLCADADRVGVVAHLRGCERCRMRVEAESTARHVLLAHAAVARTMGVAPSWRPRVFRLGQPMLSVPSAVLLTLSLGGAAGTAWWLRAHPSSGQAVSRQAEATRVTAVGVIGDSHCQHDHRPLMIRGERECTLGCVARGAEFVLVTDSEIYRLRDQQLAALAEFANRRVSVEGTVDRGTIRISRVTAVP